MIFLTIFLGDSKNYHMHSLYVKREPGVEIWYNKLNITFLIGQ